MQAASTDFLLVRDELSSEGCGRGQGIWPPGGHWRLAPPLRCGPRLQEGVFPLWVGKGSLSLTLRPALGLGGALQFLAQGTPHVAAPLHLLLLGECLLQTLLIKQSVPSAFCQDPTDAQGADDLRGL